MDEEIRDRIVTTLVAGAVGFIATKAVDTLWKAITRKDVPTEDDSQPMWKFLLFTAISAVVAAAAQRGGAKRAGRYLAAHPDFLTR